MSTVPEGRVETGPAGPGLAPSPAAAAPPQDPVAPLREPAPQPRRHSIEHLADHVVELAGGEPIDLWAIAALLESAGIRDTDAVERYGRRDVFALAQAVRTRMGEVQPAPPAAPEREPRGLRLRRFARHYGRGTFFFVPLGLQLIALLWIGISQFAALSFTLREASVLAAAASLAFLVTSPFTQALGYLGPLYSETGKHMLAERVSWTVVAAGSVATVLVGAAAWAVMALTDAYPSGDIGTAAAYYALLCGQGLASAMLYMLRRFLAMVLATILALAVAGVLYESTGLEVRHMHWIALAVGVAAQLGVAAWVLRRRARATRGDLRLAALPRTAITVRRVLPFALYGLLYFQFLSIDRVVAWASGDQPLPLWFRPSYELGLDWALAGVVFAMAFLEVTVEAFSRLLEPASGRYPITAVREHNRSVARFWARQLAATALLAAVGAWLAVGLAVGLDALGWLGPAQEVYDDPVARYVFAFGVVGYALLAIGIANDIFVMSLNRPGRALAALGPAVLVSAAVGIVATTYYAHWTAVMGLVCGAGVFAAISGWQTWRTLRRADYYNYAAW